MDNLSLEFRILTFERGCDRMNETQLRRTLKEMGRKVIELQSLKNTECRRDSKS
jgi:hypothetical protein